MTPEVLSISSALNESMRDAPPADVPAPEPLQLEPGIHRNLSMSDYLRLPYMSASRLEKLRRSPLQYQHCLSEEREGSSALDRGTALHMAILEPPLFNANYTVAGDCAQPLKSGARKGEPCGTRGLFLHRQFGWLCGVHVKGCGDNLDTSKEILTESDHARVLGMRDAILGHPRAKTLFEGKGEFEATVIFDDPETGVRCRIRPDRMIERAGMLVDIKTTRDAAPWSFPRQAEALGYFRKLAFYRRGLRAIGWPHTATAIVAPESDAPFDLCCYLAEEDDLDGAHMEVTRLLRIFKQCDESGDWPGYATEFQPLSRPAWAKNGEAES
jgi:hypothetical protein